MTDAPKKIWLRWEPGKAITQGPLTEHPDYTAYTRTDVALAMVAAAKRETRKEALREAARYLQSQCGCSQVTCMAESDCNMDRQRAREILALMEDTDDE